MNSLDSRGWRRFPCRLLIRGHACNTRDGGLSRVPALVFTTIKCGTYSLLGTMLHWRRASGSLHARTISVENAGGSKPSPRASGRTLGASKTAAKITAAWSEFGFLPPELFSACRALVERYHARPQPCKSPAEIVWRSDAWALLRLHSGLRVLFVQACNTRKAKPAKERQENVAALILACEGLVRDFDGWGAQFPDAKLQAERLFAGVSRNRNWLMDTYGYPTLEG